MEDYYKILGLSKGASLDEIKRVYRKLALKYHPDRNAGNKESEERFKKISEAYAVLSDPEKRKQYDTFGASGFHQRYSTDDIFRGTDFGSIFDDLGMGGFESLFSKMFGGFGFPQGGAGFQQQAAKGTDLEYALPITFDDAYRGCERNIEFTLSNGERRSLRLKVPAGVKDGGRLRIAGKGAASPYGGPAGDLYVKLQVASHPVFRRNESDIEVQLPLKITDAALGTVSEVDTPAGPRKIRVPPGVKSGTKIRLAGLGFPLVGNPSKHGDFFAIVAIDVPKTLTEAQRKLLEKLRESGV